jgi:hypothetical protein
VLDSSRCHGLLATKSRVNNEHVSDLLHCHQIDTKDEPSNNYELADQELIYGAENTILWAQLVVRILGKHGSRSP